MSKDKMGGKRAAIKDNVKKNVALQAKPVVKGFDITFNPESPWGGSKESYYLISVNGQNYYQRGGGMPEPTPNNMSASEFIRRARTNGALVKRLTAKEMQARAEESANIRNEMNRMLDNAYVNDETFVRGSRQARAGNRATARARRSNG